MRSGRIVLPLLASAVFCMAQDVRYNFAEGQDFSKYRSYKWVEIQGSEKVFTVEDGRPLPMESYDLVLTPSWAWHDHHNESDQDAIWMDALDVPFTVGMNLNFYEEPGDISQQQTGAESLTDVLYRNGAQKSHGARPFRYPWKETTRVLKKMEGADADPYTGFRASTDV